MQTMFCSSLALAVCAAGLISVPSAVAQTKVGVVSLQKAILETAEIKKANVDMAAKYKKRQDDLDKASRELSDIQTQLQAAGGKLSAAGEADLFLMAVMRSVFSAVTLALTYISFEPFVRRRWPRGSPNPL